MNRTLIYAHRGANREAAENTAEAFDRALAYPIDGIETDVQMSRDEVNVLWHDRYLNKLGWPGKYIDDFDYAQLHGKNFSRHSRGSIGTEKIISLRDFLATYRTRCGLLIEVKNRVREAPARWQLRMRQTLELIGEARDGILVSSFHLAGLLYAHDIAPEFPLVYNLEPKQRISDVKRVVADHPFLHGLCLHVSRLDEEMVTLLRLWEKSVAVYTCNTEEEIGRALRLGVDILITDLPQLALQMRDALAG
jgi:glycerophosphoryl diester phosphodiesterase